MDDTTNNSTDITHTQSGGGLWTQENGAKSVKNRWIEFDGNLPHMTLSFRGERYTLIYYTNKKHFSAPNSDIAYIQSMEFPIPSKSFTRKKLALTYEPYVYFCVCVCMCDSSTHTHTHVYRYAKRMERGLQDLLKWKERVENEIVRERCNVYHDILDGEINIMLKCGHKKCELKSFGRGPPKNSEEAFFRGRYVKVPGYVIHRYDTTYCLGLILGLVTSTTSTTTFYEVRFKLDTWMLRRDEFEAYIVDRSHEVLSELWLDDHDISCARCGTKKVSENNMFVCCDFCSNIYHESCLQFTDQRQFARRMWSCKTCRIFRSGLKNSEKKVWKFPRYDTSRCESSSFELPRHYLNYKHILSYVAPSKIQREDFALPSTLVSFVRKSLQDDGISPAQKKKRRRRNNNTTTTNTSTTIVLSSSCIVGRRKRRSARRRIVQ